jgi:hypothetical protein
LGPIRIRLSPSCRLYEPEAGGFEDFTNTISDFAFGFEHSEKLREIGSHFGIGESGVSQAAGV